MFAIQKGTDKRLVGLLSLGSGITLTELADGTPEIGTATINPALDDLTDVVITTPSAGPPAHYLKYNGSNWVNGAIATADLPTHTHSAADITSGNLAYARLPTGGGTWANGGALTLTGGNLIVGSDPGGFGGLLRVNGGGDFGSGVAMTGASVEMDYKRTGNAVDEKTWNWFPSVTTFSGRTLSDDRLTGNTWIRATRSGTTVSLIEFFTGSTSLRWQIDSTGRFLAGADNTLDIGASGASRARTVYAGTSLVTPAVYSAAAQALNLGDAGTNRWQIAVGGSLIAITDNTYDFGQSANRARVGYFGTSVIVGVDPGGAENLRVGTSARIGNTTGPAGGALVISNTAASLSNIVQGAGGRIDNILWDTSASADERRVDTFSLNGVGGPGSFVMGITRTDAGTAGNQLVRAFRTGNAWTSLRLLDNGTGFVHIGNGNGVVVMPDPGGSEVFRVGGTMRVDGSTIIQTGDLTLTTGRLVFSAAAGKMLMGATSLTVRDSSDAANILGLTSGGALTLTGTLAEIAINARSGGGTPWEFYVPTTASYRLYHAGDQYVFNDTEFIPATDGGKTLGTASVRWGDIRSNGILYLSATAAKIVPGATNLALRNTADSANNLLLTDAGLATFRNDVTISSLGVFQSTVAPTADQLLSYNISTAKWVPRTVQLSFATGDVGSSLLGDGTAAAYVSGSPAGGSQGGTPSAPTATALYKAIRVTLPTTLPANCVYVVDYSTNGGGFTTNAIITIANQIVHGALNPASTYSYKYLIRGAGDTAYSTASSALNPSNVAEVNAFGVILASQITSPFLSAVNANLGTIIAGRVQDALSPTRIMRFSGGTDPNTIEGVTALIDLAPPTVDDPFIRLSEAAVSISSSTNTSAAVNIVTSTNAVPISVQATAHGYSTGDVVRIINHTTNTNANGTWRIVVSDANNFTLTGSVGNGVGGATGTTTKQLAITTSAVHGYATGDSITIAGHATNTNANGMWSITVLTTTIFSLDGATGNGVGGATGKVVRNRIIMRRSGSAEFYGTLYGAVQATNLTVVGSSLLNGPLTATGSSLFSTLQISAPGTTYGTNVKRFMWSDNALRMFGDDGDANLDTAYAILGDHDVPSGTLTLRQSTTDSGVSTINTGSNYNVWVAGNTVTTYSYSGNTPSYDNNYYFEFEVSLDNNFINVINYTGTNSRTWARYQVNAGAFSAWTLYAALSNEARDGFEQATVVVQVAPGVLGGSDVINFELYTEVIIHCTKILSGTTTAEAYITRGYHYTSTAPYPRRSLFLKSQVVSGVGKPHMYLEPLTTAPLTSNSAKGEVWFKDVSGVAALEYNDGTNIKTLHDATASVNGLIRLAGNIGGTAASPTVTGAVGSVTFGGSAADLPVAVTTKVGNASLQNRGMHCIWVALNKTTTSTVANTVVASWNTMPANILHRTGAGIRIVASGAVGTWSANPISVTFGGTVVYSQNFANATSFHIVIEIYRSSSNNQAYFTTSTQDNAVRATTDGTMTITDSAGILIEFRCSQIGAGTFTFRTISIQTLDPDTTG